MGLRATVGGRRRRVDVVGLELRASVQQLADDIETQARRILKIESPYTPGLTTASIPVDLVTSSGSGLDPDISVAAARFQAPRIAAVRGSRSTRC